MIFDCQHKDDIGYFTSKGLFCSLCASNDIQTPVTQDTPLKSNPRPSIRHSVVPKQRHSRGDMAMARQLAYQDFKSKLPHYPEDKLLKLARNNAKSYIKVAT